jgi:hypothetical protein
MIFMRNLIFKRIFEPQTLKKRYFLEKQNMLSHRGEYSEQVFLRKTFSKKYPENERLCKNYFWDYLKIIGKIDFFEFCDSQNSCKMLSNPKDIVISSHLGIVSTN